MKLQQRKLSGKKQSGSVLILGLSLVLILSVIVASSAKTTILQQKMTSNLRDKELSFQAAESALKAGETYLLGIDKNESAGDFSDTKGLLLFDNSRDLGNESSWNSLGAIEAKTDHQVIEKPVFVIEELPEIEVEGNSLSVPRPVNSMHFRITAKSKGGTDGSLSVVQSMYKK